MLVIRPVTENECKVLDRAVGLSPYLRHLSVQHSLTADALRSGDVAEAWKSAIGLARSADSADSIEDAMLVLRQAKGRAHLAIAVGDLSGLWTQTDVTHALTDLADASVKAALNIALASRQLNQQGLCIFALGKMGARELNYSSDIDLSVFYDPESFSGGGRSPGDSASRVLKDVVRILQERTEAGYVFRTDLRLRPDPRSTPLAVSTRMAELYYESVGQNWERMVWIKSRPCAGDADLADTFLKTMQPFIWRRHLDYWAIDDIHSIKSMINASKGDPSLQDAACDVKLGPGGIREIEFFVQTQQLILGGRNESLRGRATLDMLDALASAGIMKAPAAQSLKSAYESLRAIEHRIQMMNDEQTHALPTDTDHRRKIAALCGQSSLDVFDAELMKLRQFVNGQYLQLFAGSSDKSSSVISGNLVFTGVDDDPGTLQTLQRLGFLQPSHVIRTVRQWHRGTIPATRTTRGQQLLTSLLPRLLKAMSETSEADKAFSGFAAFLAHLSSGVQTLSMLRAEPQLLKDLVSTLALAPRLSQTLGRRPDLLETLVGGSTLHSLWAGEELAFDEAMDVARRYHREQEFLIGYRQLHQMTDAEQASAAYTDLAETCLQAMADAAEKETLLRIGNKPGRWCVAALGKLGSREMTVTSDMDLLVVYEPDGSDAASIWFTKFTQRLITALSAQTGEGRLYEVDMRLRPSGRAGPVAVSLSAFERYQREDAWTWEHMALTRLRPTAGDEELRSRLLKVCRSVLSARRDPEKLGADVLDMRERLARERPGAGLWDMKLAPGGLVDMEFIIQYLLLLRGGGNAHEPSVRAAVCSLGESGHLDVSEAGQLLAAHEFTQAIQHILRLAVGDEFTPESASSGLRNCLAAATGCDRFEDVVEKLKALKSEVTRLRQEKIGPLATD